jgi:WD repeat-containing protein 35
VDAYLKLGDVKSAIDVCVKLNFWSRGVELARLHNFKDVEGVMGDVVGGLIDRGMLVHAVELYRKAHLTRNSAVLLFKIARTASEEDKPLLHVKKLYVLAAQEADLAQKSTNPKSTSKSLDHDAGMLKFLASPWRPAEALHFYSMTQRYVYAGALTDALKPALALRAYTDIIPPMKIHSLIALVATQTSHYATASKSFIKLERIGGTGYQDLAFGVFKRHEPVNVGARVVACTSCNTSMSDAENVCGSCGTGYASCIVTGRPIIDFECFTCTGCKHKAIETEIRGMANCPLVYTGLFLITIYSVIRRSRGYG